MDRSTNSIANSRHASPRRWTQVAAVLLLTATSAAHAGVRPGMIGTQETPGAFRIAGGGEVAPIVVSADDHAGVARAARDLAADIGRVTGTASGVSDAASATAAAPILIGTLGKSPLIDRLAAENRIDVSGIRGQWESYVIHVVADPLPGVRQALVIAGSDKRGTIYGTYDVSENIGVSPWYWWADVPPRRSESLWASPGPVVKGPPAVKYRGIFINDEAPALTGWAREKFGGLNSKMYTRVFELLLRLRGNYLWPAMWGNAFNEDDPENARLADEYGIVMGTSHQEPMLRAQAEFDRRHKPPAEKWNYATHPDLMESFWREGVRRNKDYESIVTMGLRGRDDTEMIRGATVKQSSDLLEKIVAAQRRILVEEVHPDIKKIPQVWTLYKEVQTYYEQGLRVPDDVALLWAEDNWGNIRRVPTPEERKRPGGAGIYYHFDYVGAPRNYKWVNTNPLPKIQEQLNHVYQHGADRIWIVNVGDIKPMELPIEFFLTMAWDPNAMTKDHVAAFTRRWAERDFGPEHAAEVADLIATYGKYVAWRKPELLSPTTFSLEHYEEAERVEAMWDDLIRRAEAVNEKLRPEQRDAFFQFVLHPARAVGNVTKLYVAAGRNALYARQGRVSANAQARLVRELFTKDKEITQSYHALNGGKWNHFMNQVHIGYTSWNTPKVDAMPALAEVTPADSAKLGVAVEGSASAWPGAEASAALPSIDTLGDQRRWIDVFGRSEKAVSFTVRPEQAWLKVDASSGDTAADRRLRVSVDWAAVPAGRHTGTIEIVGDNGETVAVSVPVHHDPEAAKAAAGAFGTLTGSFTIPADAASKNVAANGARWETIPDYGRVANAMSVFPVTAESVVPPARGPYLEYPIYLAETGEVTVEVLTGPTIPFVAGRGLRVALSIGDGEPVIFDAKMGDYYTDPVWVRAVSDNARKLTFKLPADKAGRNTLKVWMVDPGIVLQQLVVHVDPARRPSYFGPPARTTAGSTAATR